MQGYIPKRILIALVAFFDCGLSGVRFKISHYCGNSYSLSLRARAKITSHFRMPSSDHLRPRLNRGILGRVLLFLWFRSIGAAKSDLNLCANSVNLFLREP